MKRPSSVTLVALALLAGLLCGNPGRALAQGERTEAAAADLWLKAVEFYRANLDWYPGRAAISSKVLNGNKKFRSLTEMVFTLRPAGRGRLRVELESSRRNGVDTTKRMRLKARFRDPLSGMAPSEENGYSVSISDSPFDPKRQEAVSRTGKGERRTLSGRPCRRFDFVFRNRIADGRGTRKLTWSGQAWIEEKSGRPVLLDFSVAPLPGNMRSMRIIYQYETDQPDRWAVKSVVISGHGGFLFAKRYFTVTTTFSEYGKMSTAGEDDEPKQGPRKRAP